MFTARYKLFLLIISVISYCFANPAQAAQALDCINVQSSSVQVDSYSRFSYTLQINSLCSLTTISDIERIRGTSITLEIRGPQMIKKLSSVGNLSSSQKISFDLGNLKDGTYSATLQLFKPSEGSRSIPLQNFKVSNVLECIDLSRSYTDEVSNKLMLKVYLRNTCMSYSDSDFANFGIKVELITDYYPLTNSGKLSLDRLSSSETLFVFPLDTLPPGIYMTSSIRIYTSTQSKDLYLDIFAISKKTSPSQTPSPSPTKTLSANNPLENIKQCVTSKGFDESCTYAPDWYFEFCAVYTSGSLEQKIGTTWKFIKSVKTTGKESSCGKNPNLFEIEGINNSSTKKLTYRVRLKPTSKYAESFLIFYVTPKYMP